MKNEISFSVIIPTFNRENFIIRAINSVVNQQKVNFEIIVVDDGSTDNSVSIIKDYIKKHLEIKINLIINKENKGVSYSRNIGVKNCKYDYICFLDSDDEWHDQKLFLQSKDILNNPNSVLFYTNENWIRNDKKIVIPKKLEKKGGDIFIDSLETTLVGPSTVVIRKEIFEKFNGFNESFPICEDNDLWLKILLNYRNTVLNENPLINKYDGHQDQLSHKFKAMDFYRVKSIHSLILKRKEKFTPLELSTSKKIIIKKCKILLKGYKKYNNLKNFDYIESIYQYHL